MVEEERARIATLLRLRLEKLMPRSLLLAFAAFVPALVGQAPPNVEATFVCEGRVVDLRGEGIPVATVRVVTWDQPETEVVKSITDGDGYFRIGKVPLRPRLALEAESAGRSRSRKGIGATSGWVEMQLQHAAMVRGVLRNRAGEPVADVHVRARLEARILSNTQCDGRSDAEGRFELLAVPLGPCRIGAWIEGEGVAEQLLNVHGDLSLTLAPTEEPRSDLKVTIEGLPEGNTENIGLMLLPYTEGRLAFLPPPYDRPAFTDGSWQGRGVPDRDYTLYPTSTKFAFSPRQSTLKKGKGPHQVTFAATPLGTASLLCKALVRGTDDGPVASLPFVMRASNSLITAEAVSAPDGTLQFASPLAAGTQVVVYTTDPRWVVDQEKDPQNRLNDRRGLKQHEATADPSTVLQLRVIPACTISGKLLLADGRPASFVRVELQERTNGRWPEWMGMDWATTQRDGTFSFTGLHHLDDSVRLSVESAAGSAVGEPLALAEPGTTHAIGVMNLTEPSRIEGVVRDAEQKAVGGIRVWLRDWEMAKGKQKSGSVVETITDREGHYRFVGVPPGGAWLQLLSVADRARLDTRAVEPFEVEAGKTYTFDLQVPSK